jgi:hypothetical protein
MPLVRTTPLSPTVRTPPKRLRISICFAGEPRALHVLTFRGVVFYDFNEWRCMLCELSGAAARCFTHDACEERLWCELELAHTDVKRTEAARLLCSRREGRYVDRQALSQLIFTLEPTRHGCALIYALSQIEIHCTTTNAAASSPEALYLGTASLFQLRDAPPEPTASSA